VQLDKIDPGDNVLVGSCTRSLKLSSQKAGGACPSSIMETYPPCSWAHQHGFRGRYTKVKDLHSSLSPSRSESDGTASTFPSVRVRHRDNVYDRTAGMRPNRDNHQLEPTPDLGVGWSETIRESSERLPTGCSQCASRSRDALPHECGLSDV